MDVVIGNADQGKCWVCGDDGPLEQHHVSGRKNGDIIVPVCVPCHRQLTEKALWWYGYYFRVNPGQVTLTFLLGLRDLLYLRSEVTGDSTWKRIADLYKVDVFRLWGFDDR